MTNCQKDGVTHSTTRQAEERREKAEEGKTAVLTWKLLSCPVSATRITQGMKTH